MREKEAISQHFRDIDGLVVDAHILETFQNATSGFIINNNLNYIIDPITYRFALDQIRESESKRWYDRLVEHYSIDDLLIDDGIIKYGELTSSRLQQLTSKVINYQNNRVKSLSGEMESWLSLLSEEYESSTNPLCVIPPYFIIDSERVIPINVKCINYSHDYTSNRIYAYVPIFYDLLFDYRLIDNIIEQYSRLNVNGYFVWITDFNEVRESTIALETYASFLKKFKETVGEDKDIINMFGGFFSTILSQQGIIDGLCHGVGFSESRNPYSAGGPAPTRFYVPALHRMLTTERAQDISDNITQICPCPICAVSEPSSLETNQLTQHTLNAKVLEKIEIESLTLDEILEKVRSDATDLISSAPNSTSRKEFNAYTQHLFNWINSLQSVLS